MSPGHSLFPMYLMEKPIQLTIAPGPPLMQYVVTMDIKNNNYGY